MINFPVIIDIVAEHHDDYHILQLYKLGWIHQDSLRDEFKCGKRIIFQARREIFPRKVLLASAEYDLWMLLKSDEVHEWLGKEDVPFVVASEIFWWDFPTRNFKWFDLLWGLPHSYRICGAFRENFNLEICLKSMILRLLLTFKIDKVVEVIEHAC